MVTLILQGIGNLLIKYTINPEVPDVTFAYQIVAAPIMSVLFAPIVEEVIYRKIIFGWLNSRYTFLIASVISSVIFMVSHYNYAGYFGYFIAGMIWCYVYKNTKNLGVIVSAHMIANLLSFIKYSLV